MAVSDRAGRARMELSAKNCGDHRLGSTPTAASGLTIEVEVETLDDILPKLSLKPSEISVVWVDTQGYEANVLAGAKTCIEAEVPFFIEFWPQALQQAGGYEKLLNLIETYFDSFIEVRPNASLSRQPVKTLRNFARKFEGTIYHTDLLLLPKRSHGDLSEGNRGRGYA